jgi:UDP-4-amino-4,6-dideoxy-N-acetyl-beta-L-altrosamine N-acetyltransferase
MSVNLRPMTASLQDTELCVRLVNEYLPYFFFDKEIDREQHLAFVERSRNSGDLLFIIESNDVPCGMVSIYRIEEAQHRATWGRFAVDSLFSGVGAIVEYMVLQHVFESLQLNRLYCEVLADNTAVMKLHQKFGFQREGTLRKHLVKDGTFRDVVLYGLLADEWREIKARRSSISRNAGDVLR